MAVNTTQNMQAFALIDKKIVRFTCPKNIKFGQDSFGKIDVTCLDAESKQYLRGMRDPGEAGIGINYNDENTSHEDLLKLAEDGTVVQWFIGSNHSAEPPTYTEGSDVTLPKTRNWWSFNGYMNDTAPNDIEVDAAMAYDFTIIRTSKVKRTKREVTA